MAGRVQLVYSCNHGVCSSVTVVGSQCTGQVASPTNICRLVGVNSCLLEFTARPTNPARSVLTQARAMGRTAFIPVSALPAFSLDIISVELIFSTRRSTRKVRDDRR